jgi:HEAT repeat protein
MLRPVFILMLTSAALVGADRPPDPRTRCYEVLVAALKDESQWVRAHAAEALVQTNRPAPALDAFRPLADTAEPKYRVVTWRILAQAEPDPAERRRCVERIRAALLDRDGPDQTHAMEALAKLNQPAADDAERVLVREIAAGGGAMSPFALWRLAQAGEADAIDRLRALLRSSEEVTRARAEFVLSRAQPSGPDADAARETLKSADNPAGRRYLACTFLADHGGDDDLPALARLLDDPDSDVRVGAAFALLRIGQRNQPATKPGQP